MKRTVSLFAVIAMLLTSFSLCASAVTYEGLVDSGLDYTESTEVFNNPMMGNPSCIFVVPGVEGNTPRNDSGFVHYFIDMKNFSGGYTIVKVDEYGDPVYDEHGDYVYANNLTPHKRDANGKPLYYDANGKMTTTVTDKPVKVDNTKYSSYAEKQIPLTEEMTAARTSRNWGAAYTWACDTRNMGGDKDIPLSEDCINFMRGTLENLRKNGGTCIIRPSYAKDGERYNEPLDFNVLMGHARQLCELFTEFSDVVGAVEVGTIGPFGEMWGSPYCSNKYYRRIIDLYLSNTPDTVKFMVRNMNYIKGYMVGDPEKGESDRHFYLKDGTEYPALFTGKKAMSSLLPFDNLRDHDPKKLQRLSMFNDGYMLTNADTGTWGDGTTGCDRKEGVKLLEWFSEFGYYGGEYGSGTYAPYNTRYYQSAWLPYQALPEMYKTHVSYIHGNIYASWKGSVNTWYRTAPTLAEAEEIKDDWIYESTLITKDDPNGNALDPSTIELIAETNDPNGQTAIVFRRVGYDNIPFTKELAEMSTTADCSAFYGYSCYTFIAAHLGYRFVIRDSKLTKNVDNGGVMRFNLDIENTGFGNCVQDKIAQLVIVEDGNEVAAITLNSAADANSWLHQETHDVDFEVRLPNTLEAGEYDAYLRVCNVKFDGTPNTKTCVRFANNDVYSEKLGANYIGSFNVSNDDAPFGTEEGAQVATKFDDVKANYWGREYIEKICTMGNMGGMSLTTFVPEGTATRAQLVTVLYNMEGKPAVDGIENPFKDVKAKDWFYNAVMWASENGIVGGTGAGKFDPNVKLNRETFATMLFRYAKYKGIDVASVKGDISAYKDANKVSSWALESMQWANAKGYIGGMTTDTLVPKGNATRAQMATILTRYIESNL